MPKCKHKWVFVKELCHTVVHDKEALKSLQNELDNQKWWQGVHESMYIVNRMRILEREEVFGNKFVCSECGKLKTLPVK